MATGRPAKAYQGGKAGTFRGDLVAGRTPSRRRQDLDSCARQLLPLSVMNDSLLVSVSSYRPRPGRESIEDFITEAFA